MSYQRLKTIKILTFVKDRFDFLVETFHNKGATKEVGKQINKLKTFYDDIYDDIYDDDIHNDWERLGVHLKKLCNSYRQLHSKTSLKHMPPEVLDKISTYLPSQCGQNELCLAEPHGLHIGKGPSCVIGRLSTNIKGTMHCWKSRWDAYIMSSGFIRIATKMSVLPIDTVIMEFKNDYRKYMQRTPTDVPPTHIFRKELMSVLCKHYFSQVEKLLQTTTDNSLAWLYEPTFLASLMKSVIRERPYTSNVQYFMSFYMHFVEYLFHTYEKDNRFETIYQTKVTTFLNEFDDIAFRTAILVWLDFFKRSYSSSSWRRNSAPTQSNATRQ